MNIGCPFTHSVARTVVPRDSPFPPEYDSYRLGRGGKGEM